MSLDVYLNGKRKVKQAAGSGIFVRDNGKTVEITEEEWKRRHPDREPVRYQGDESESLQRYHDNITHNLGMMAQHAGLYEALWRPEEKGWKVAKDLIAPLEEGLKTLKWNPKAFKAFNPQNGWGDYDGLVEFVENYLKACRKYPTAEIEVSR